MGIVTFLIWLVVSGLIVGALARLVVPGRQPIGLIGTAVLGIAGSFVGGLIFWAISDHPGKNPAIGFLVAIACAAVLLYLFVGSTRGSVFGRRRRLL
ncbi:MAG: GlsB/YeaQ/YmgE family stress response membrane protein [Solirubrobacterales bacterium]